MWHFQAVKHDIWDRDFPPPPALVTIRKDGRRVDVVAQAGKNGRLYVFDRETGEPVFPMEEVDAPPSDVPGERTAAKQLLPSLPPPFTRQRFTEDLVTNRTPEAARAVKAKWDTLRKGGEFDPPSLQGTVLFPGMDGGAEWGGIAYDASSGLLYVNANEMAWIVRLAEREMPKGQPATGRALYEQHCAACHGKDLRGTRRSSRRSSASPPGATRTRWGTSSATAAAACRATPTCRAPCSGPSCATSSTARPRW